MNKIVLRAVAVTVFALSLTWSETAMAQAGKAAKASAAKAATAVESPPTISPGRSAAASSAAASASAPATAVTAATAGPIVDINKATSDELKKVPGIGDAYAAKIIAGRPYANKAQLVTKHVMPQGVYDKVKARLIAKQ